MDVWFLSSAPHHRVVVVLLHQPPAFFGQPVSVRAHHSHRRRSEPGRHSRSGKSNYRPRTAYVGVLHPSHDRTKYHLVYLSSHPLGIVKFMHASERVDIVQARVRAAKQFDEQAKKAGTPDMFADAAETMPGEGRSTPEEVDGFWRRHLGDGARRIDTAAFADILESTNWLPGELQASLIRPIQAGELKNLDDGGKKRPVKPLHFDKGGERLGLTDAGLLATRPTA